MRISDDCWYGYGAVVVRPAGDDFLLECGRCEERVVYSLQEFTIVEAQRHEDWCREHKGAKTTSP